MQIFLALAMSASPLHFEFEVSDERINCCIIVTALYAVAFLSSRVVLTSRGRPSRGEIEVQGLVDEERNRGVI
jgi:hypothetical protein